MRKILLVNPSSGGSSGLIDPATAYPPLGLAYLASYIREKGSISYDIKIIDANILRMPNQNILRIIKDFSPDIIGLHMNVILARNGLKLCHMVKKQYPKILLCIGGPIVSSNPKKTLKDSNADVAITGEGEDIFLEICEGKKVDEIKGIAYFKDKKIVFTGSRPLIENLDTIPHPAYDLLPDFKIYRSRARKIPVGPIITSRGCPFQCTFCSSSVFGKKFRAHTPEYIIEEIDMLVNKYGARQLDVLDDNLMLDKSRAEKIFDLIIQRKYKLAINLQSGIRVENLDENIVKKMKKAGVFKAGIGIESANKEILKSIKKSLNIDKVIQSIRWFRKYGIISYGFFIIGFPNDTDESINETINFALRINPTIANFMILVPFPGTEIYELMKKNNLLISPDILYYTTGLYESKMYHKCMYLSNQELLALQRKAYSKFNFRVSKILETLSSIRSFNEFRWTLNAGLIILKNIIFKSKKKSDE